MDRCRPLVLLDPDSKPEERANIFAALGRLPNAPERVDVLGAYPGGEEGADVRNLLSIDHPRGTEVCVHAPAIGLDQALASIVKDEGSPLIVLGMHQRTGLQTLRRSSCKSVLNSQAKTDFLMVNVATANRSSESYKNVLIAVDGTSAAVHVIDQVRQYGLNKSAKSILTIVPTTSAIQGVSPYRVFSRSPKMEIQREIDGATRKALSQLVKDDYKHVEISVAHGHTGATIASKAREIDADLIVMGSSPRSSLNKWMLGSTVDFVLNHAPCDCLVIGRTTSP